MAKNRVETIFDADAAGLVQAFMQVQVKVDALEDQFRGVTREPQKLTAEQKRLAREAKRVYEESKSPQERHAQKVRELQGLVRRQVITQEQYAAAVRKSHQDLDAAGRAGRKAFGAEALGQLKSMAFGYLSIGAAIGGVAQGFRTWIENMREAGAESRKMIDDVLALAALQEPGTRGKRTAAAMNLAAQSGIKERGVAMDVIQGMQSALGGDFDKGLTAAREVFAAKQAGMQLEDAKELATLAAGLGFDPGTALRRAHVAGEASTRSPRELAKGAAGMKYWQDRELGWAAAATLAGTVKSEELGTYLKRGGIGLSTAPGAVQKKFESLGLGEASQLERLEYLHKHGVTSPEAAARFGFTEIREGEAISDLAKRFPEVKKYWKTIHAEATPGLFQRERAGIEAEVPGARFSREMNVLDAQLTNALALGPKSERARLRERDKKIMALALRNLGHETFLGFDLITEGESPTLTGVGAVWNPLFGKRPTIGGGGPREEYDRIVKELNEASNNLNRAAENLNANNRQRPVQQTN